jgi:hypothetical protein
MKPGPPYSFRGISGFKGASANSDATGAFGLAELEPYGLAVAESSKKLDDIQLLRDAWGHGRSRFEKEHPSIRQYASVGS